MELTEELRNKFVQLERLYGLLRNEKTKSTVMGKYSNPTESALAIREINEEIDILLRSLTIYEVVFYQTQWIKGKGSDERKG